MLLLLELSQSLGLITKTLGFTSLLHTCWRHRQAQNTRKRGFSSYFVAKGYSLAKSSMNRVHRSYIDSLRMVEVPSNTDSHRKVVGKTDIRAELVVLVKLPRRA